MRYPSGNTFTLVGVGPKFLMLDQLNAILVEVTVDSWMPSIKGRQRIKAGTAVLMDPRAIIRVDVDGEEVYNPRLPGFYEGLTDNWKDWLRENPWWPGT